MQHLGLCSYIYCFSRVAARLEDVQVGGTSLPSSKLALVDSGSTYMVGPNEAVGEIARINGAECFDMSTGTVKKVACSSPNGFDAAAVDCEAPFFPLEFIIDGVRCTLEKNDLLLDVPLDGDNVCLLRTQGSNGIPVRVIRSRC